MYFLHFLNNNIQNTSPLKKGEKERKEEKLTMEMNKWEVTKQRLQYVDSNQQ